MNLFLKTFLWFLAAVGLLIGVSIFLAWTTQNEPIVSRFQNAVRNNMAIYSETAAQIFENEGEAGLKAFLQRLKKSEQIVGVAILDQEKKVVHNDGVEIESYSEMIETAWLSKEAEINLQPQQESKAVKSFKLKNGKKYALLLRLDRPRLPQFFGETRTRYFRLIGLILTALIVCYLFARYLSAPIVKLSEAAKEFAAGNLQTRVSNKIGKRHDEIAKLAEDFDEMAERIGQLIKSEKRLTQDISHELRSPLARMNVALEIAKQKSNVENQPILERIEIESNRLNEMISRLLMLSTLENNVGDIEKQHINLRKLVENIATDADFEAQAKNKSVKIVKIEDCHLLGNENLLRSAVENVLRNAVRYTEENAAVEVSLEKTNETAQIIIKDFGGGVPEDELENLFRPFYRVGEARERKSGGVGLGLAIAQRAVHAHKGLIKARNAEYGLRVEIKLPLNDVHQ
jgi:two-component system sensor histidine kinase CpxA